LALRYDIYKRPGIGTVAKSLRRECHMSKKNAVRPMIDPYRLLAPFLWCFDAETAHAVALHALKSGIAGLFYGGGMDDASLASNVWGKRFSNPIGLAAGFDKNGVAPVAALKLGFGFVEVGGVTPKPQKGNPRPRLFRLEDDRAVINRMGFNNEGMMVLATRLAQRGATSGPVGVNLGKNKDSEDAASDYAALVSHLSPHADFLVINVSSPNTPGLRALQSVEPLLAIVRAAKSARAASGATPPLLLKIAPDLTPEDIADIARVALDESLDGLVVSNTTISRPESLRSPRKTETGGLSGAPVFALSTRVLRDVYKATEGKIPLIGVGGVASGADAYAKIKAGASLVQLYSALVYEGPGLVARIKRELIELLRRDGFTSVSQAVGTEARS